MSPEKEITANVAFGAVVSRTGGKTRTEIFVAPLDGRIKRVSIATSCFCQNPSISPDGKHVVYQSCDPLTSPQEPNELFVATADGNERWNITNNTFVDQKPRWSPDGFHIAFESNRGGVEDLYLTDMRGTSVSKITGSLHPSRIGSWSPDGGALVYCSLLPDSLGATWQVFTVSVSGGEMRQLTSGGEQKTGPVFSPSGDSIAYLHGGRIFVMDSEGLGQREIPSGVDSVSTPLEWSLDGRIIFYTGFSGGRSDIYRVRPDGSQHLNLTRLMDPGSSHPVVLYDGLQLAFVADIISRKRIYLMELDGLGKRPLSPLTVEEFGPVARRQN
ncbi:MAG: hypothetical protein WBH56_15280 [Bacteroidota bacterium]